MKIVSWNVNGIRAVERKKALQEFLADVAPDVLYLQEIKGTVEQFSTYLTENDNYATYYHSAEKAGYAGTGIWIRKSLLANAQDVAFDPHVPQLVNADEGRVSHLRATIGGVAYSFISIYFPNGGKSDQAWKDKLVFYDQVLAFMDALHAEGHTVILGGDMNVAHNEIDIARPKENDGKIGFHPDERAWMDRVMTAGWADAWRAQHPEEVKYSWWNMVTRARARNVGWRIDYFFVHTDHMPHVTESFILNDVMGSDHCPVGLVWKP